MPSEAAIPLLGIYIKTQPSVSARSHREFRVGSSTTAFSVYLWIINSAITAMKADLTESAEQKQPDTIMMLVHLHKTQNLDKCVRD